MPGTAGSRLACTLALLVLLHGPLSGAARAAEFDGQNFDDSTVVAGTALSLNGVGLRSLFILKVFLAALYLPAQTSDPARVIGDPGPRRLQLRLLMDLSSERLARLMTDAVHKAIGETARTALRVPEEQFGAAIRSLGKLRKGDRLDVDLDQDGIRIALNGAPRAEPIASAPYYAAMLNGFVGEHAIDKDLRLGLLGQGG